MAKYTIEITEAGKVETLEFMGKKFTQTWVPADLGSRTIEKCLEIQAKETFSWIHDDHPDLERIECLSCADMDEIEEIVIDLSESERGGTE